MPPISFPIQAIHIDGEVILFYCLQTLEDALRSHLRDIGDHHIVHSLHYRGVKSEPYVYVHAWVLRDDDGCVIDRETLRELRESVHQGHKPWSYYERQLKVVRDAQSRGLPIPRTGKRSGGHYFRRIHTTQELRALSALAADRDEVCPPKGQLKVRKGIPNSWDDVNRNLQKNWKRYRRFQARGRA